MLQWVEARAEIQDGWFTTGVYYEQLAYFLHERNLQVCVLVASRTYHWAKSLPIKSKTDAIDARLLACYGLEHRPRCWPARLPSAPTNKSITPGTAAAQKTTYATKKSSLCRSSSVEPSAKRSPATLGSYRTNRTNKRV